MPIFPRRQLQLMLDELGPWLTRAKATDLVKRIDNVDPDQSIPGEYELAVGWALSKLSDLEIGPPLSQRDPDFLAADLFPGQPSVIEVTALSDDALSAAIARASLVETPEANFILVLAASEARSEDAA